MDQILVVLFCVILVVGANGSLIKLSTSINQDTIELFPLFEQFWSLKPTVILNSRPLAICKFIEDCCGSEERLKAIPILISSPRRYPNFTFPDVINICVDSSALNKADKSCPSLEEFSSIPLINEINDPARNRHEKLMSKYGNKIFPIQQLLYLMEYSCNSYEYHAFLCLSDKKLLESCIGKALQQLHDDKGYEDYYEFIIKIKQILTDLNKEQIKISVDDKNID